MPRFRVVGQCDDAAIQPSLPGLLAPAGIGRETSFPVQWVAFDEDPQPAARVAIRYEFHEQLVRLGVLPREDDLSARENASGFDHRYAPDPYRNR